MTRADFFRRIAAFCGIGAIAATVKPAAAEKNVDLTVTDWTGGMRYRVSELDGWPVPPPGYTFRWTGVVSNDWTNGDNWLMVHGEGDYSHIPSLGYYPGQDPNRLDDVIIPTGKECMMPEDLPMLNSLTIESGGTLWQSMDAPYETSPSWLRRLIVEDGAWVGRRRT